MFSWDEKKYRANWQRRKVDFAEAIGIFDDHEMLEVIDDRKDYGETRIQALGQTEGVFYLVVYVWRGDNQSMCQPIYSGNQNDRRGKTCKIQDLR